MTEDDCQMFYLAYMAAAMSPDPSTQNGVILRLAGGNKIAAWNDLPRGVADRDGRLSERPKKYAWVEHAERAALHKAAFTGWSTDGAVMYAAWAACADCARAIIGCGVREVVTHVPPMDGAAERFRDSIAVAREMFAEAGVVFREVEGAVDPTGQLVIRRDGKPFYP